VACGEKIIAAILWLMKQPHHGKENPIVYGVFIGVGGIGHDEAGGAGTQVKVIVDFHPTVKHTGAR
jgi:hypothetical protein